MTGERAPLSQDEIERRDRITNTALESMEAAGSYVIPVMLDLQTASVIVGQLQLALRAPRNVGLSAEVSKAFIRGIISRVPEGVRGLLELGNDPRYDSTEEPSSR